MKSLAENDGQNKEMAEALDRVTPFDAKGSPRKVFSPAGLSQLKCFFSPDGDSQMKTSPAWFQLTVLTCHPPYVEEGASWNYLPR